MVPRSGIAFMRREFLFFGVLVALLLGLVAAGCGADDDNGNGAQSAGNGEEPVKVAILFTGPRTGGAFDTAGSQALDRIESELGAETAFQESVDLGKQVESFADFARQDYDIVIGHSDAFFEGAMEAAEEFPDTVFVATTGADREEAPELPPNVVAVGLAENEIGYLSGYTAGLVTEADDVGWVGSIPLIGIGEAMEGHRVGVEETNPDARLRTAFVGSFTDAAKGKEAALSMINSGADFLTHNADQAGLGVIRAAAQEGVPVIGNSIDQSDVAPEAVVTSVTLDFFKAYGPIVEEMQESGEVAETARRAGVAEGVVGLAPIENVSDEVREQVETRLEEIRSGEFDVPDVTFVPDE
jgi:basic membrane protein A and related proteins